MTTLMAPGATARGATRPALDRPGGGAKPVLDGVRPRGESALVYVFTLVPMLALVAAVPLAWGWGLSWVDVGVAVGFYLCPASESPSASTATSLTAPSRRTAPLRNALAIAGSLAGQGDVITWTADHRRHHAFADKEGDPHSPWLFGTGPVALAKGFCHAHLGWMFGRDTHQRRPFHPRPARRPRHRPGQPAVPAVDRGQPARPGRPRRSDHHVVLGCADRILLGRPRADRGAAPRHLVDQLDLPHDRRTAVPRAGQGHELLAAGDPVDGRVLAQPAPRRSHLRPARRRSAVSSTCPRASSGHWRSWAGRTTSAGPRPPGWPNSMPTRPHRPPR